MSSKNFYTKLIIFSLIAVIIIAFLALAIGLDLGSVIAVTGTIIIIAIAVDIFLIIKHKTHESAPVESNNTISRQKFYLGFGLAFILYLIWIFVTARGPLDGFEGLILATYIFLPLFVIFVIVLFIYEFLLARRVEVINYALLKKTSLILLIVHFVIIVIKSYLIQQGLSFDPEFWAGQGVSVLFASFWYIILFLLALLNFYLAKKQRPFARKLIIISLILGVIFIADAILGIRDDFVSSKFDKSLVQRDETRQIALEQNNFDLCTSVSVYPNDNDYCIQEFAVLNSNPEFCLRFPENQELIQFNNRFSCFLAVVKKAKDKTMCDFIAQNSLYKYAGEACIKYIDRVAYDGEYADLTASEAYSAALENNDMDICQAIKDDTGYQDCQGDVAAKNTMNDCAKMDTFLGSNQVEQCYAHFDNNILLFGIEDKDGDGLDDEIEEDVWHTDPNNPDTDGDGYNDKEEIINGFDPLIK